jgi:hypothetical protein
MIVNLTNPDDKNKFNYGKCGKFDRLKRKGGSNRGVSDEEYGIEEARVSRESKKGAGKEPGKASEEAWARVARGESGFSVWRHGGVPH